VLADRLPQAPIPTPAQAIQEQRNAEARWSLLQEFEALSGAEISARRSSSAKNPYALASRWRREGKIFAVESDRQLLYPSFQLDSVTFEPLAVVTDVLATLPREEMSNWEIAFWWTADNDWLDGERPVDLMRSGTDAVVIAAAHLAEPSPL
jgi:hypothetical protein